MSRKRLEEVLRICQALEHIVGARGKRFHPVTTHYLRKAEEARRSGHIEIFHQLLWEKHIMPGYETVNGKRCSGSECPSDGLGVAEPGAG